MSKKSTLPQNGKTSKVDQTAQIFDSKLSKLQEKVPSFVSECSEENVDTDLTETITKLKELLTDEENSVTSKNFNREINLWQHSKKKKIPAAAKQGLNLQMLWQSCEEKLSACAKESKGEMMWALDVMLTCIGETYSESETEEVSSAHAVKHIGW